MRAHTKRKRYLFEQRIPAARCCMTGSPAGDPLCPVMRHWRVPCGACTVHGSRYVSGVTTRRAWVSRPHLHATKGSLYRGEPHTAHSTLLAPFYAGDTERACQASASAEAHAESSTHRNPRAEHSDTTGRRSTPTRAPANVARQWHRTAHTRPSPILLVAAAMSQKS